MGNRDSILMAQLDQELVNYKNASELPKMPTTASDWQLYDEMKGVDLAARNISLQLAKALKILDSSPTLETVKKIHELMLDVLIKYKKFGAYDTEPRQVLRYFLAYYLVTKVGFGREEDIANEMY